RGRARRLRPRPRSVPTPRPSRVVRCGAPGRARSWCAQSSRVALAGSRAPTPTLHVMSAAPHRSTPPSLPDALAAIDIGTNSVHMLIARIASNGRFEVVTRQKEMVRLGSGEGEMKQLEEDAIERGIQALARCRQLADSFDAPVYAVATSAVREALN